MHLWTDYEGNTIAGYLLGRLNRSEGRNAFFATTTSDGQRALLRLTESHFDEAELITRWRKVAPVSHPNLQAIKRVGHTTFDGVSLACCLLEPTDGSLADALRERPLSVDETKEVAEAVSGALAALHSAGLVHEHVDATNVFASGEVIKLRSDCSRECAGDFEADTPEAREALRQRDVHDMGLLLLRCLGLEWQGNASMRLPSPFDKVIPGALDGRLTAQGVSEILQPPKPAPVVAVLPQTPVVTTSPASAAVPSSPAKSGSAAAAPAPVPTLRHRRMAVTERQAPSDAAAQPIAAKLKADEPEAVRDEPIRDLGIASLSADLINRLSNFKLSELSPKAYVASGAAALVLGLAVWAGLSNRHAEQHHVAMIDEVPAAASQPAVAQQAAPQPSTAPEAETAQNSLLATSQRAGWRVIAYTYRYEQEAQAQVMKLQRKYARLHPQVFTPTGRAPYFVALGSPTDAATAMDLRNRARHVGLPRDTYARNF